MTPSWEGGVLQVVDCVVDLIGIEPMTSSMPWKRAPSCATGPHRGVQLSYCLRSHWIRQTRLRAHFSCDQAFRSRLVNARLSQDASTPSPRRVRPVIHITRSRSPILNNKDG